MRRVAPGFQQTSGSKEAATSLRRGHIQRLNLRYTQVSRQELRCPPQLTQRRPDALELMVQGVEVESIRQIWALSELGPLGVDSFLWGQL